MAPEEATMRITHRTVLPALALGFLLAAAASAQHHGMGHSGKVDYDGPSGGDPDTPAGCPGAPTKIQIAGATPTFSPATVTIDAGQPVCWTWTTTEVHNVRADDGSFGSGEPTARGTFQKTFTTPGTYGFHCQVHGTPGSGMSGTVVVRDTAEGGDDEGPGKLQLAVTEWTVDEGAGVTTVAVERVDGSDGAATVKYAVAPGSAKPGKDYLPRTGVLRWANGEKGPKSFDLTIKNDTAIEPDERFSVKLSKATGAPLGAATAAVTIHDDDGCDARLSAPAKLSAAGQSASEIRLAWSHDPAAATALRVERRAPGGAFQEIAALPPDAASFVDSGLPEGALFHYRIGALGMDGVVAFSGVAAAATDGSTAPCGESAQALCLDNGRFEATVEWQDGAKRGARPTMAPESASSGLFSFSTGGELDLLLTVRDGCAVNDRYWLDVATFADAEFTLEVRDTQTGRTWVRFNPAGAAPTPLRDREAFATCP
jgi:plastocyanin